MPEGAPPPTRPEAGDAAHAGGYVLDNMEGAVDRAAFLAATDIPVAVVGARGTGKLYVARVLHREAGLPADHLETFDCRAFRNRETASAVLDAALASCEGKTLVFKYPHLMAVEAQLRLARQLATRRLADRSPPRSLGRGRFVALFPDSLEQLVAHRQLQARLASVFAGYPIHVPPIRARKRAVLRWAEKILAQECQRRALPSPRFTPEAQRAMLAHDWGGNISELRQRIVLALGRAGGAWLGPTELGLEPLSSGSPAALLVDGFGESLGIAGEYAPDPALELEQRLAEAVHHALSSGPAVPLGTWLADSLVLLALEESAGQAAAAARLLHTTPRNVHRWLPRVNARESERQESLPWRPVADSLPRWLRSAQGPGASPLARAEALLLRQLELQGLEAPVKRRAEILGVSPPTYHKKRRVLVQESQESRS